MQTFYLRVYVGVRFLLDIITFCVHYLIAAEIIVVIVHLDYVLLHMHRLLL